MDLSKLSDNDLRALKENNFSALSDEGLIFLKQATAPQLTPEERAERQGFGAAFGESFGQFGTAALRGIGELTGSETLTEAAKRREAQARAEPGFIPTTEEDVTKAFEEGILPGIGAGFQQYISEPAGELAGQFVAPAAVGLGAAALAPKLGLAALGTYALTGAATALAEFPSALGDTIQRMEQEGKEVDVSRATAFAIPQAVLYGFGLPGVGALPKAAQQVFKSQSDDVIKRVLAGELTKDEGIKQLSGYFSSIAKQIALAGASGAAVVTGAEALKRSAAGQGLTDEEALDAYLEQALAAGALSPFFGVPLGVGKRAGAVRGVKEAGATREAEVAAQRRAEGDAAAEQAALGKEGLLFRPDEFETAGPPAPERVEVEPGFNRFELTQKEQLLTNSIDDIRTRIEEAAQARDFGTVEALSNQARTLQQELAAIQTQLKEAGGAFKSVEALQKELDTRTKALQKAATEGDTDRVAKLIPRVRELEQELIQTREATTPSDDLFARADRAEAAEAAARAEGRARVEDELAQQTEEFQRLVSQSRDVSDDIARRLDEEIESFPEILKKTADENLIARMDEVLQKATQNNATQFARTSDDVTQREITQNQEKIERLKRTMQEVVESGDLRPIPRLRNRLAELLTEARASRPEVLRSNALEDQMSAVEAVRSSIEDIRAGRFLGKGARDTSTAASTQQGLLARADNAVGAYADAAIREINAVRRQNKQEPMTVTEATRLAMDVRGRLENVIKNKNAVALQMGKSGVSPIERQLAQIKQKYQKGAPLRRRAEGFALRQEQDVLEALRRERAKPTPDPERLRLLERQVKTLSEEDARLAEARLREREAEGAAERVALSGIPGEGRQLQLFGERDLEPIATTRATPQNFMRYLRSGEVQKMRESIADVGKQLTALEKQLSTKAPKQDPELQGKLETQRRFVQDVQNADKIVANLRRNATELWTMRGDAQKALKQAADALSTAKKAKQPVSEIRRLEARVREFEQGLSRLDATAEARMREIDMLHARANKLLEADLAFEKAILKDLERKFAKQNKASPAALATEANMRNVRAQIGQTEAAIRNQKEAQAAADRAAEQARLEAGAKRPKVRREIVETPFKVPGAEERVLRKRTEEIKPKAKEEISEAQKQRQLDIAEQIASRRAAAKKRTLAKALQEESRLSKELEGVRNKIKAAQARAETLKTGKAKENAQTKIKQLLDEEDAIKKQLDEIKPVGTSVERAMVFKGDKPARETPTKPLKTGQLRKPEEQQRKAFNKFYEDFKEFYSNQKNPIDADEYLGPDGTAFRALPVADKAISPDVAAMIAGKIETTVPSGVKVKSVGNFSDLPQNVKDMLARDNGIVEGTDASLSVRGFVTPDGDVYVVRNNHGTVKDLEATYVHELVGHVATDRLLGPEGMKKLSSRIESMPEGAFGLARALGIETDFRGSVTDMMLSIRKLKDSGASSERLNSALKNMEIQSARELLAYTAEKRVTEDIKQKLGRWYKEIIGVFRDWMRRTGMAELAKVSDADIYNIVRKALRNYKRNELGAHRNINGDVSFRKVASVANPGVDPAIVGAVGKIVGKEQGWRDSIKASSMGMQMMHRFVDRFAGLDFIARTASAFKGSLEGVQMMYYNRIYDQRNNMVANIATNGPVRLVKNTKDGTFQYKSSDAPSLKKIFETLKGAQKEFGNERFTVDTFGTYLAVERAASDPKGLAEGLKKLDMSGKITPAEAQNILKVGRANEAFQKARGMYREYNNGLIGLLEDTGRISKEDAARFRKGDYVPYYRERNGEIWDVEHNIRIGDVKNQPMLRQLVGGDSAIVNFEVGALQNTYMLTEMALGNNSTKNTAYTLQTLGIAEIRKGKGPASPNVIRFYENGEEKHAELSTKGNYLKYESQLAELRQKGQTSTERYKKLAALADRARESESLFGDIPAELIVKGMDGISLELPLAIRFLQAPANLLRKAVTRNPAYAARIAMKDSLSGWITTGADVKPVIGVLGNLKKSWKGDAPAIKKLQEQGIIGGHVFNGTMADMRTTALQISRGEKGWEKLAAKADRLAILADEAARVTLYDGFIKKGMTEMEATLATLEAQNFTKHGFSPSVRYMSTMIPFFNAQIQGLNVFARALAGKSLFEDKLGVRAAALQRGSMIAGGTMLYSMLMQDTEAYKNATQEERMNYWFVPLPFFDEPVRVPIPFEAGLVFKALPEAMVNLAQKDKDSSDVFDALKKLTLNSIPGASNLFLPQGAKPLIEVATNTSFYGFRPIEGLRAQQEQPGYRFGTRTTEVAKAIGEVLNVSPLKIDALINGYTSSTGIALLSVFNPILRDTDPATMKASEFSIVGGFFQPTDGVGIINKVYEDMKALEEIGTTYKRMAERDPAEADRYLNKYTKEIELMSLAGSFRREMGELNKTERAIRADKDMAPSEKRKFLDDIRQSKIELAKLYRDATR